MIAQKEMFKMHTKLRLMMLDGWRARYFACENIRAVRTVQAT